MFSPHDLDLETDLDVELRSWLAFARQKLDELAHLKQAINHGIETVAEPFALSHKAVRSRRNSLRTHNPQIRKRLDTVNETMLRRDHDYKTRKTAQARKLSLPPLPTTTIGSFPQTPEIRAHRSAKNKDLLTQEEYVGLWEQVLPALTHMVHAAQILRQQLKG